MTETERKPYVPRHAKKIEEPPVPETEEEITVIETVQEEAAEEEIPAALPEGETDDRKQIRNNHIREGGRT